MMLMLTYFFFCVLGIEEEKKNKVDEWECFIIQKLVSFFFWRYDERRRLGCLLT
jgi:hypothetical protein